MKSTSNVTENIYIYFRMNIQKNLICYDYIVEKEREIHNTLIQISLQSKNTNTTITTCQVITSNKCIQTHGYEYHKNNLRPTITEWQIPSGITHITSMFAWYERVHTYPADPRLANTLQSDQNGRLGANYILRKTLSNTFYRRGIAHKLFLKVKKKQRNLFHKNAN